MSEQKHVVFRLESELYSLPIASVERILADQATTKIPRADKMVLGVFDLRGTTVPAIDLRTRLGFVRQDQPGSYIVVSNESARFALKVDGVEGIYEFSEGQVEDQPSMLKREGDDFLAGVARHGDKLVVVLDPEHVLPGKVQASVVKLARVA